MTSEEFNKEITTLMEKATKDLGPHKVASCLSQHLGNYLFEINNLYENLSKDPSNNTTNSNSSSTNSSGKSS